MARIQDLLDGDLIIEDLRASDKEGVIREFASLLAGAGRIRNEDDLVRALLEREAQGSTGIGDGIAIPHAKSSSAGGAIVAFGRSARGVDFKSLDGKPSHLFFLLVTPERQAGEHLKTLARIARILRSSVFRDELLRCTTREGIRNLILAEDGKHPNGR